jgi:hypothetical protein
MSPARDAALPAARSLVLCWLLAAAFAAAAWGRLGMPFSDREAAFVHQSLRDAGQVISPDFGNAGTPQLAAALGVVRQLAGTTERSLRLLVLALVAAAACLLAEAVHARRAPTPLVPCLALLALPAVSGADLVQPWLLLLAPAAAMLGPAASGRMTTTGAVLAILGALALGALDPHAAAGAAVFLVLAGAARGPLLDRLIGLTAAALAVVTGWRVHEAAGLPAFLVTAPDLARLYEAILGDAGPGAALAAAALAGIAVVSLTAGGLARDGERGRRLAPLAGLLAGAAASTCLTLDGAAPGATAALALIPALLALVGRSLAAVGRFPPWIAALTLAVVAAAAALAPRTDDRPARRVLDEARGVAMPGSALAIAGPHRAAVAVEARLGRSVPMPTIYVPEHAPPERLADLCRSFGIRRLWTYPRDGDPPPGLSAPESRPFEAPALRYLIVETP